MFALSALAVIFTLANHALSASIIPRNLANVNRRHIARDDSGTTFIQTGPLAAGAPVSDVASYSDINKESALSAIATFITTLFQLPSSAYSPYFSYGHDVLLQDGSSASSGGNETVNDFTNFSICQNYANEDIADFSLKMAGYILGQMESDGTAGCCFYFFCNEGGGYFGQGAYIVGQPNVDVNIPLPEIVASC